MMIEKERERERQYNYCYSINQFESLDDADEDVGVFYLMDGDKSLVDGGHRIFFLSFGILILMKPHVYLSLPIHIIFLVSCFAQFF